MRSRGFREQLGLTLSVLLGVIALPACGATPLYGVCSSGTRPISYGPVTHWNWDRGALPSGTAPAAWARPVGGDVDSFGALPDLVVGTISHRLYEYQYTGSHGAGYYVADCGLGSRPAP